MATKKTTSKKTTKPVAEPKTAASGGTAKSSKTLTGSRHLATTPAEKKKPVKIAKTGAANHGTAKSGADGEGGAASEAILARAEQDVTKLLESLNTQMSAAMHAFEELAAIHRGRGEAVIRTRPLDRATAVFQRLLTDVMDERFAEFLPTLVALRVEMDQRAKAEGDNGDSQHGEFFTRGTEMLDQVLAGGEVQAFEPKVGDAYDPLIHLAVGETQQPELAGDVVSQVLQGGFRTVRGKVIHSARVKVNRR